MIAMPMPASPQNSSSLAIGSDSPVGSAQNCGEELEAVQADLGRLLDHRPGGLLALVPFGGGRAHDVGGEAVHPVAQVPLVLARGRARTAAGPHLNRQAPPRPRPALRASARFHAVESVSRGACAAARRCRPEASGSARGRRPGSRARARTRPPDRGRGACGRRAAVEAAAVADLADQRVGLLPYAQHAGAPGMTQAVGRDLVHRQQDVLDAPRAETGVRSPQPHILAQRRQAGGFEIELLRPWHRLRQPLLALAGGRLQARVAGALPRAPSADTDRVGASASSTTSGSSASVS